MMSSHFRTVAAALCIGLMATAVPALAEEGAAPSEGPAMPAPPPGPPPLPGFHSIVSRMSPEGRTMLHEAMKKAAPEKEDWKALKATREEILKLMAAPKLDVDALERMFERERALSVKLQSRRHEALLKAARRMSTEDRQIFAEGLRNTKLHIPGETVKMIYKRSVETQVRCRQDSRSEGDSR